MKILVVTDTTQHDITHVVQALENWNYQAVTVQDDISMLALLKQPEAPSIVMIDCPQASEAELDLFRNIRANVKEQTPYLIMLTSSTDPHFLTHAIDAGADDYASLSPGLPDVYARIRTGRRFVELAQDFQSNNARDELTRLRNRGAILDVLRRELGRRDREHVGLSIVFLVVDQIAQINQAYGHLIGDIVLREIADRIQSTLRPYDAVGRYSGATLLIVLPNCSAVGAVEVGERARMAVAINAIDSDAGRVLATVSVGIATSIGAKKIPLQDLLQQAKMAVERAKKHGGNWVESAESYWELRDIEGLEESSSHE